MTKTDERLRELEEYKSAQLAAQTERDKSQKLRDDEQTRRYEELKKEIECLHEGMNTITKILQNGLSTATRANTEWRDKHQKEHEDSASETRKDWKGLLFGGASQIVSAGIGAAITLAGLWASGRLHVAP